ncbi:hypothetical protein [Bartonella quintana]|nr:hypothetical protein [Bartonella quintana]
MVTGDFWDAAERTRCTGEVVEGATGDVSDLADVLSRIRPLGPEL